jgi:Meiotically up-regulated gene 113
MGTHLHTRLVSSAEFWQAFHATGAVYFIRNAREDTIKVGHSRDPRKRLSDLQVGCSSQLELIGVIAAAPEIEPIVHQQLREGRIRGEWFWDRGVTSQWLLDMTQGEPLHRHVWRLVKKPNVLAWWDEATHTHTKHVWDKAASAWVPTLPAFKAA